MTEYLIDGIYFFLNRIVAHIPIWNVRKLFYRFAGMKIGKRSRILMGCIVMSPWKIVLGEGVYINENCVIDGRGHVMIGDNTSISIGTKIFSGTHASNSDSFEFVTKPVRIENNVWTGIDAIVLPGAYLPEGMILAAGSVAIPKESYKAWHIYSGVPAVLIRQRGTETRYEQGGWRPILR